MLFGRSIFAKQLLLYEELGDKKNSAQAGAIETLRTSLPAGCYSSCVSKGISRGVSRATRGGTGFAPGRRCQQTGRSNPLF